MRIFSVILATSIGLSSMNAFADPSPALDRFSLSVGGYYVQPTFNIGVNTDYGRAETGDLKRDHATLGRIRSDLLLGDHQGLAFDYYRYSNSFDASIARTATLNGQAVTGDASADARLKIQLAQLAYKWWLGSGNTVFGVGLGAAYYQADLNTTARGSLDGVSGVASYSRSDNAIAPLLEVGVRTALSDTVRLYAEASGVKKNGGSTNGHIYNGNVGIEWFPLKNVGIGADYGITKIQLYRDAARYDANLGVKLVGPTAYVKVRF
ncbi:hypothetical protein [Collimonas pratensis]|uniref:Outer membrane beta-barrel domain protein n=1 Tax=Collimonas pratensis TaxID=279113 RepID=A0ABM5Z9C3_9BURK|nr:hypothetical protein [Collimonas pratensis]AMP15729.1 hypothetical protein CPter291_3494 [Collimonas pratensis]